MLKSSWQVTVKTYWVPALTTLFTTVMGITLTVTQSWEASEWSTLSFLAGILCTIIFGGVALLNQDRVATLARTTGRYVLAAVPVAYFVIVGNYYGLSSAATGITFALLVASSVFFLLCSAELRRDSTSTTLWQFGLRTISVAIIATAVGVIGHLAASLAAVSIHHLFQIEISSEVYASIAIIMFACIAPLIVIASISHVRTISRNAATGFSPLLLRLVQIVFTPILIAYFLILYAYLFKILFQWELPQESVVLPVLVYTIVGVCTYVLVDPWRRANVHPTFGKLQTGILISFLPLLVLYFFAIVDRIRIYGMTEPRYLTVCFGIWLLGVCAAYLYRRELTLRWIPITLSLLFFIAALPGIGAVASTTRSQQTILVNTLHNKSILVNGNLVPAQSTTDMATRQHIESMTYLLLERRGLQDIASQVGLPVTSSDETVLNSIQAATGRSYDTNVKQPGTIVADYTGYSDAISVTGYDEIFDVNSWPSPSFFSAATIRFSTDGNTLIVQRDQKSPLSITFTQFPNPDRPTYDAENEHLRVRIIPTHIIAEKTNDDVITIIRGMQLRVLVDYKDQP